MTEAQLLLTGLAALLTLDLTTIAVRAAFLFTNHARLITLRDAAETQVNQAVQVLYTLSRLRAAAGLTLVLTRSLLAGIVVFFVSRLQVVSPIVDGAVGLLLGAALLFWLEWGVEKGVSRNAERWALRLAPYARGLMTAMTPLLALPLALTGGGEKNPELPGTVTPDEVKSLVDAGQEEGVFEHGERRMIYSIFDLGDTLAREIMVPRIDMKTLDVNTPLPEAVDTFLSSGHSRVPVYEETVDRTLGLLYVKDLLQVYREGSQIDSLRPLLRPAYFVPEAKKVAELLAEMQKERVHIAIVVDEYGGVAGLVTLEDIVEEILGEIQDEYDEAEESPYQALQGGDYIFLGRVDMDDFNEVMGSELPKDEADTLGGFIYSRLGRVPDVGEVVREADLLLIVEQVKARRIGKVRARWEHTSRNGEEDNNEHA